MDKCPHGADPKSCGEDPKACEGCDPAHHATEKDQKNGNWPGP